MATITMLHPGAMGAAVAGLLVEAGHDVRWAGDGRSQATRNRAIAAGLDDHASIAAAIAGADVVISLCPPSAALAVADHVAAAGFAGCYVDANAVRPSTARAIAAMFDDVVDGSVIGGPPVHGDDHPTRLYLSGPSAPDVAALFDDDALEVMVMAGAPVGSASAVKVGFAGWTKGTAALLLALRAMARAEGVEDEVLAEWRRSIPGIAQRTERVGPVAAKAWRFEGELRELGAAMAANGLPDGFHLAAADVYHALADLRHASDPTVDDVLGRLAGRPPPDQGAPGTG
jgi:3-hydroxyisobutyrate dehydrogenase-like beta-hydroxyacid dehydrogenase